MDAPSVRRLRAPTPRMALAVAAGVVFLVLLWLGRSVLTPFIIGVVLIYVLSPAVEWLAARHIPFTQRRLPRGLAVLLVYVLAVVILVEGFALLLRPLLQQVADFVENLPQFGAVLDQQLQRVFEAYESLALPAAIRTAIDNALAGVSEGAAGIDFSSLLPVARTIAGTVAGIFGFLIVPVWAFYILKDRPHLIAGFDRALPEPWRDDIWAVLRIIERDFGRWLRGQLLLGLVVGVATFGGLMLLGATIDPRFFQFAILLAVVAGVFELLPIIGPILSMIPTLLVALTISPLAVVAVVILYLVVQQLENNVLVPKIQGDAIDLHPAVVIFSLVLGGAIAGLLGAIFALPIAAAMRDVYKYLFRRVGDDAAPGAPPADAMREFGIAPRPFQLEPKLQRGSDEGGEHAKHDADAADAAEAKAEA